MEGSYSIKKVLPALIPDLNYDDLEISDGSMAMYAFSSLKNTNDADEIVSVRTNLLKYCEMDTLAMVKIWEKLSEIAGK